MEINEKKPFKRPLGSKNKREKYIVKYYNNGVWSTSTGFKNFSDIAEFLRKIHPTLTLHALRKYYEGKTGKWDDYFKIEYISKKTN